MGRLGGRRLTWLGLAWVLLCLLGSADARAENLGPGGGTRVIVGDQLVGPYRLFITSSPEPAQVGVVTYVVRVSDPATGEKVRDATVVVRLAPAEGNLTLTQTATHEDAGSPVDYAAHIQMDQPGMWNGTVRITGPAGFTEVAFFQRILAPRGNSTLLIVGLPFMLVLLALGVFWYLRTGAHTRTSA